MKAQCHCGNVTISIPHKVESLTSCNCSICHRLGALWGYYKPTEVEIKVEQGEAVIYQHGDRMLNLHHCGVCGCSTHWTPAKKEVGDRMAVNYRMLAKEDIKDIHVRLFDGADTWEFIEE